MDSASLSDIYPKRVICRCDLGLFVCTAVKVVVVIFFFDSPLMVTRYEVDDSAGGCKGGDFRREKGSDITGRYIYQL